MFQLHGFTSRPVRYAIVATHAFRTALEELSVDEKIEQLAAKVAELQERLESLDDSHIPQELEAIDETSTDEPKTKAKRRTTTRKPSAKTKK